MMSTILQLLSDGADPCLVRCPQPALLIAIVSGCPDLVRHLVNFGSDVNEVYPQVFTNFYVKLVECSINNFIKLFFSHFIIIRR